MCSHELMTKDINNNCKLQLLFLYFPPIYLEYYLYTPTNHPIQPNIYLLIYTIFPT